MQRTGANANASWAAALMNNVQSFVPALQKSNPRELHEKAHANHGPTPLTVAEIQAHPEFPHAYWDLKPETRAKVEVAKGRGGPFKLAYEVHGHGPNKILVGRLLVLGREIGNADSSHSSLWAWGVS